MPKDAPAVKIEATKGYGAEVVLYDRYSESREEIGQDIATKTAISDHHPDAEAGARSFREKRPARFNDWLDSS